MIVSLYYYSITILYYKNQYTDAYSITILYYKNQYTDAYKTDDHVIKQMIRNNVKCNNSRDKLKIIIYYKNSSVSSVLTKSYQSPPPNELQKTKVPSPDAL